jgi:MFS family permease
MAGVAVTIILVAFDSTIVGTTLPRVAQELGGMSLYAWVGSGYLLASAITIPIFGRLGDLYGRKPFILASVAILAIGSVLCGLSQTMQHLIAARTLQGLGGGMMIATAFAAPADLFPDPLRRVRWQALLSTAFAMASGIGPVLGGLVTEAFGWRAAFAVTPITAVFGLFLLFRYFPNIRPPRTPGVRVDWVGGLLLILAVGAPMLTIEVGFAQPAHPVAALGLAALAVAALIALVFYERRHPQPMFPMRVLAPVESRLLNGIAVMVGAVMFVLIYYAPLLLQTELGVSPSRAGALMIPLVAGIPVGSLINGQLYPRMTQPQRLLTLGSAMLGLGCLAVITFDKETSSAVIAAVFLLCGAGLGFLLPNLTLFMQMICERRDVGMASALVQMTRAFGSALGVALAGVVIARSSVMVGMHTAMVCNAVLCGLMILLARRVRMRNTR